MNAANWLLHTDSGIAGLILRRTLAVVMFPHGAQKVLEWFGGFGAGNWSLDGALAGAW
jgi:putative oxidoreductase